MFSSFEVQKSELAATQLRHVQILKQTGIADAALRRRFDPEWYGDSDRTRATTKSMPIVMIDDSSSDFTTLYVFLDRGGQPGFVVGEEVNIANILHPNTLTEKLMPEEGFTINQAKIVKALANELLRRKETDLPYLSDDLIRIVEPE